MLQICGMTERVAGGPSLHQMSCDAWSRLLSLAR